MANYKPIHTLITSESISQATINAKTLSYYLPSTTVKSLHDTETNANYQVPTGKTFNALGVMFTTSGIALNVVISQGDTADTETLIKLNIRSGATTPNNFPLKITFASDKFVNIKETTGGVGYITMQGYET